MEFWNNFNKLDKNIKIGIIALFLVVLVIILGVTLSPSNTENYTTNTEVKPTGQRAMRMQALRTDIPKQIFMQTDPNGNISTFDFSTDSLNSNLNINGNFSGDNINGINVTATGEIKGKTIMGTSGASVISTSGDTTKNGYSVLHGGGEGANAGYVAFHNPGGTRKGYVGWDNDGYINLSAEVGALGYRTNKDLYVDGNITTKKETTTKNLNIITSNPAGNTHLNWIGDGKNYLTGETTIRGGNLNVENKVLKIGRWTLDASDDHLRFRFDGDQKYVMHNSGLGFWSALDGGYLKERINVVDKLRFGQAKYKDGVVRTIVGDTPWTSFVGYTD